MTSISNEDRRTRLGVRHHLAEPADDVVTVASDLAGLHSSDPATVYLAAWARVEHFSSDDLAKALYEDRTLVRMLGMRRTMFVVTRDGAATMDAAATKALVDRESKRTIRLLEESDITDDGATWLARVAEATMQALGDRGEATAKELSDDVPDLKERIRYGEGTFGMSTRVLFLLATQGRIVRGQPLGTWLSSQYRWTTTESWLGAELPTIDEQTARTDLVGHYLSTFGPATELDVKWWTGWNLGVTRQALADVGAIETETGYVLAEDLDPIDPPGE